MTWLRESHQLFDYHSTEVDVQSIEVTKSGYLIRQHGTVVFDDCYKKNDDVLLELELKQQGGVIQPFKSTMRQVEPIWLVVQQNRVVVLKEGDVIKLGRINLKICEIVLVKGKTSLNEAAPLRQSQYSVRSVNQITDNITYDTESNYHKQENSRVSNAGGIQCRICFSKQSTQQNPLLAPCNCKGSMQHIHYQCLREWMQTKFTVKQYPTTYYVSWRSLKCEVCGMEIPEQFPHLGNLYNLLKFTRPTTPYIIVERIQEKEDGKKTSLFITKIQPGEEIKLGRGADTHIKVNDISVSRHHSSIIMSGGNLLIEDRQSKFGTLLMTNKPMDVAEDDEFTIQQGRSVLRFDGTKKRSSSFFGCYCKI